MVARRSYAIVFAFVVMLLSLALVSFGTYALFTSQRQITGHLQSGKLDVAVTRTYAKASYVNPENGMITYATSTDAVELDAIGDVNNVFNMPQDALIVPTCKETATFKVSHADGSNVAFDYYLKFVVTDGKSNMDTTVTPEVALELAKQLKVTVQLLKADGTTLKEGDSSTIEFTVDQLAKAIQSLSDPIDTVLTGDTGNVSYFKVTVEFKDLSTYTTGDNPVLDESQLDNDNNKAMSQKIWFDMVIIAKQADTYAE